MAIVLKNTHFVDLMIVNYAHNEVLVMSLSEVELQLRMVSLESNHPTGSLESLTHRLTSIMRGVRSFFEGLTGDAPLKLDSVRYQGAARRLKQVDYVSLRELSVPVPLGLIVNYPQYLDSLKQSQDGALSQLSGNLQQFHGWLARLLSQPELLRSIRTQDGFQNTVGDRAGLERRLVACFREGAGHSERPFGEVFQRVGEWTEVAEQTNRLVEFYNRLDRRVLMGKVEAVSDLLTALTDRVESGDPAYVVSHTIHRHLSDATFEMAKQVEHYSSYSYQLARLVVSLNDAAKRIEGV